MLIHFEPITDVSSLGRMISLNVGSFVKNVHIQLNASSTLFRNPAIGIRWIKSQRIQANVPLIEKFGRSTTARYFEMIAIDPLFLYAKGDCDLRLASRLKFSASDTPC